MKLIYIYLPNSVKIFSDGLNDPLPFVFNTHDVINTIIDEMNDAFIKYLFEFNSSGSWVNLL